MKFLCAALVTLLAGVCLPLRADMIDGINAIVNDKVITYQEVHDYILPAVDALQHEYADQPDVYQQKLDQTLKDGLETLIENQLILNEFATKYNPLPDSIIDEVVQERIKDKFGDRITCIKTLQAEGETFERFREEVREQYIISALREKNLSDEKIIVSPFKIQSYYLQHQDDYKLGDEVKLQMIVLTKTSDDDTATRKLADEILGEVKKGTSFEQLVSIYSQDKQQQGSDWMETSALRKELADALSTMTPGQTSGVIETSDNCYILRLDDKRPTHVQPLADVHESIEKTLKTQEQQAAQQRWIESLKKKAYIRFF